MTPGSVETVRHATSIVRLRIPFAGAIGRKTAIEGQAIETDSAATTSLAARSPERIAPSIHPHITDELSVPAQWMRPHGSRSVYPNSVSTPVGV